MGRTNRVHRPWDLDRENPPWFDTPGECEQQCLVADPEADGESGHQLRQRFKDCRTVEGNVYVKAGVVCDLLQAVDETGSEFEVPLVKVVLEEEVVSGLERRADPDDGEVCFSRI